MLEFLICYRDTGEMLKISGVTFDEALDANEIDYRNIDLINCFDPDRGEWVDNDPWGDIYEDEMTGYDFFEDY